MEQKIKHCSELVDAKISDILQGNKSIDLAMRYCALAPGKRIRPYLFLATAKILALQQQDIIDIAAAIELVHTYSLVHDDLPAMDDATYRRGQLTCHRKFDEATAILAGDALLTLAFEIIASNKSLAAAAKCELVALLAKAAGKSGMIYGQMLDIQAMHHDLNLAQITELQELKTGRLFAFCCNAAAIIASADQAQCNALDIYTKNLGLIFQITDDILDYEGDAEKMGKDLQQDQAKGKATFISLLGIKKSKEMVSELLDQAKSALDVFGSKAEMLVEIAEFVVRRKS